MSQGESHQMPRAMMANGFGEVNIRRDGHQLEVQCTIQAAPFSWPTGVALDASTPMKLLYGREIQKLQGLLARDFISYLANEFDADRGTTIIYWACADGGDIEVVGDFTAEQCKALDVIGPRSEGFGDNRKLLPAVRYFVDRLGDAEWGMYLFLTDGRVGDLEDVKAYTIQLAREIAAGKRNPVHCVLIGMGNEIDKVQWGELDDLDTGTDVDIWNYMLAAEMKSLEEIFYQVVSKPTIILPSGRVLDNNGKVAHEYSDGVPVVLKFELPGHATGFTLEWPGGSVTQDFSEVLTRI